MKGNIITRSTRQFKYNDKYNTYIMILRYIYLNFFVETYNDERSIRDICKYRVPPFMHEFYQRREYRRAMYMCRDNSNIRNFDRDEYRYMMHYMGDYYG